MKFGISFVGYSKKGLIPIISTKLPFVHDSLSIDTFLQRFSTPIGMLLGQGDLYQTGLFGSYPVPNINDYVAYSYSFFLPDTILGTPRGDLNAYVIAIFFLPKNLSINTALLEDLFESFSNSLTNLNDLISKTNLEKLVTNFKEKLFSGFDKLAPMEDNLIVSGLETKKLNSETTKIDDHVFIDLKTENENIVALPWILHAVYHGLEKATIDILGESNSLLEMLMEQYTADILDRYHLFDSIFEKETPTVKDALDLGVKHLAKVGEYVTVKALDNNKFECSINCSFASAVHPYLPIKKCLWMRYLSAMVRHTLPPEKDLILSSSEFDPDFGSKTILEVVPRVFKEV